MQINSAAFPSPYNFGNFLMSGIEPIDYYNNYELNVIDKYNYERIFNIKQKNTNCSIIPQEYKYNLLEIRKEFIAGILESNLAKYSQTT